MADQKKPSIAELEAMLESKDQMLIDVLPNGEVRAFSKEDLKALKSRCARYKVGLELIRECAVEHDGDDGQKSRNHIHEITTDALGLRDVIKIQELKDVIVDD